MSTQPLLAEAARRSGLLWVRAAGSTERPQPMWHLWHDGVVYLLTGGIEQPAPPGVARTGAVAEVTLRGAGNGSRLVTALADVTVVEPHCAQWDRVIAPLKAKRLNAPDGERAPERWARECTLLALRPQFREP